MCIRDRANHVVPNGGQQPIRYTPSSPKIRTVQRPDGHWAKVGQLGGYNGHEVWVSDTGEVGTRQRPYPGFGALDLKEEGTALFIKEWDTLGLEEVPWAIAKRRLLAADTGSSGHGREVPVLGTYLRLMENSPANVLNRGQE